MCSFYTEGRTITELQQMGRLLTPGKRLLNAKYVIGKEKYILKSLLAGVTVTGDRLVRQGRLNARCPLCGNPQDDLYHRIVECPRVQEERMELM